MAVPTRSLPRPGLRLVRKRITSDATVAATIVAAVLLTTLVLGATPLLLERLGAQALEEGVLSATEPVRSISVGRNALLPGRTDNDPFGQIRATFERFFERQVPPSVQAIVGERFYVVDTPQFVVTGFPGEDDPTFDTRFRFRYQQGVDGRTTLVEGALPTVQDSIQLLRGPACPDPGTDEEAAFLAEPDPDILCEVEDVAVHQAALTAQTAAEMGAEVGSRFTLQPDTTDRLFDRLSGQDADLRMILEISGIIELTPPEEPFWFEDDRLHQPRVAQNADFTFVFATGLMDPVDYQPLIQDIGLMPSSLAYRLYVDPGLVQVSEVELLAADLRGLQASFGSLGVSAADEFTVVTGLSGVIDRFLEQRRLTTSMLSLSLAGLVATALAVVALLAALVEARQRRSLVLLRNRGSSRAQLVVARILQGLALAGPGAVLGMVAATALAPEVDGTPAVRAAVGLALGGTAAIVAAGLPWIRKDLGTLQSDDVAPVRVGARRLVLEGVVLAVAIGVVVLVRRRGATGVEAAGGSFDPLLALAPAILGGAAGLLTVRLYGLPIRGLSALVARRRGVVTFVGLRRVLRQVGAARLALVVVLLGVSTAVFASVVRYSIDEGQLDSTWRETGAAYRLTGGAPATALSSRLDLSGVGAIEATSLAARFPSARAVGEPLVVPSRVDVLALDTVDHRAVVAGTRAEDALPELAVGAGTEESPLPAVVSRAWGERAPIVGDRFTLDLGRVVPSFVVVEVRDRFPAMPLDQPFVIVDRQAVEALEPELVLRPTIQYVRAPATAFEAIESAIVARTRAVRITAQGELYRELREAPFVRGANRGLGLVFTLSVAFAVVGAVSAMALTAAHRRRDVAYLRTLGLDTRQAVAITIVEQVPLVIVATLVGALVGVGTVLVFEPGIDLTAFAGERILESVQIDAGAIAAAAAGVMVVMALAVVSFGWMTRRESLGTVLRLGDE